MHLPIDIVDHVILMSDTETKFRVVSHLRELVSEKTFNELEQQLMAYALDNHRKLLCEVLSCLKFHVWDDGTPIKKCHGQ